MSFKPTPEQEAALASFSNEDNLVLEAGAGTGKTSTLKLMAQAKPNERGLYVAYNRAIKEDAKKSFPRSCYCATAHGLAYKTHAIPFKHRLPPNSQRVSNWDAARILGINSAFEVSEQMFMQPNKIAALATGTVTRFCYSADSDITKRHVPFPKGFDGDFDALREVVLPYARKAWGDVTSKSGRLRFTHDHYLTMWALDDPKLRNDYILFDEAQDANPRIAAVIERQKTQLVMVGDRSQAIYGWRGAVDAMTRFNADARLMLSQSFRFGPAIADEANKWLGLLDAPLRLSGFDQINSVVEALDDPDAVLCRTNAEAVAQLMYGLEENKRVAIVGGTKDIKDFARAVGDLKAGKPVTHPELIGFESWDDVKEYVEEEGKELKVFVNLIDAYGVEKVLEICDQAVEEEDGPDFVVSTAHKAKGREWDRVKIAADFAEPDRERDDKDDGPNPEFMLAYVAVTRAKQVLDRGSLAWVDELMLGRSYREMEEVR